MPSSRLFPDKYLQSFYEQIHNNRRDYVERMWGTVQYFTTVVTSLITISLGGIFFFLENANNLSKEGGQISLIALAFIMVLSIGLTLSGMTNLKRECENEYVQMGILISLEHYMGLHRSIPLKKRFFLEDEMFIPNRIFLPKDSLPGKDPDNISAGSLDDFVKSMMKKRRSFYKLFRRVFLFLIILSTSIIGFLTYLFFTTT